MQNAGAGAHPLGQPRVDQPVVPGGVLVDQRAVQDPGDDLHVAVWVGLEAGSRSDDVVVGDQQQPEVGVGRVAVVAEREGVVRVEPPGAGVEALARAPDVDDGRHERASAAGRPQGWGREPT